MEITAKVSLRGMKRQINRKVKFSDKLSMQQFCEDIIVSMNGNCKHLYQLIYNDKYGYLGPNCKIQEPIIEEMMEEKTLECLNLKANDKLLLDYDFRNEWEFDIEIISVTDTQCIKDFEVIDGRGCGIIEDIWGVRELKDVPEMSEQMKNFFARTIPGYKGYDIKNFDKDKINLKIAEYPLKYKQKNKHRIYEINVSLKCLKKEIQRKIIVDGDVRLDTFCRLIICTMRGNMEYGYSLKIGKEFVNEEDMDCEDLNSLDLQVNNRLEVIYDWGDNWIFEISVRKILEGYGDKRFKVIDGKGYGIIDDCVDAYELAQIFDGKNTYCGKYDINDFNLDEINKVIDFMCMFLN